MATTDSVRENVRDELRALRDQVNELMDERVTPYWNDAQKRATTAAKRARAYTEDQADVMADRVRDQPLVAIAIAAIVGFLFGRITK